MASISAKRVDPEAKRCASAVAAKRRLTARIALEKQEEYNRLRAKMDEGPVVLQAFQMMHKEPPTAIYPGGQTAWTYFHAVYQPNKQLFFFSDDDIGMSTGVTTFEELLQCRLPPFLKDTIPMSTTQLASKGAPLFLHRYMNARGEQCEVVLAGLTP